MEVLNLLKPFAISPAQIKKLTDNIKIFKDNEEYFSAVVRCWFCKENKGNKNHIVTVPMYGDVVRDRFYNQTKVSFKRTGVPIPRCTSCNKFHYERTKAVALGITAALFLGLVLNIPLIYIYSESLSGGVYLLCTAAVCGFIWVGYDIASELHRLTSPKKIGKLRTRYKHPQVIKLLQQGWSIGDQPSK